MRNETNEQYAERLKKQKHRAKEVALIAFKNKKCTKCSQKVICVYAFYDEFPVHKYEFIEGLCIDHATKMSDGSPGYKEMTLLETSKSKREYFKPEKDFELSNPPKDACYNCGKKVMDENEFIMQGFVDSNKKSDYPWVLPAIPVEPLAYWICKEYCDD
jgi:hypothetical protein